MRASFSWAWWRASHMKKPTRNNMATIGMLSGFLTMSAKSASSIDRPRKIAPRIPSAIQIFGRHHPGRPMLTSSRIAASVMKIGGLVSQLTTSLRNSTAAILERP
jgi:hypothetical protein